MSNLAGRARSARKNYDILAERGGKEFTNSVYPSMHFFERVVERNFEGNLRDILVASLIAYKFFKETTYSYRKIAVTICGKYVAFEIKTGSQSGVRSLIMSTIYDIEDVRKYQFDEVCNYVYTE